MTGCAAIGRRDGFGPAAVTSTEATAFPLVASGSAKAANPVLILSP